MGPSIACLSRLYRWKRRPAKLPLRGDLQGTLNCILLPSTLLSLSPWRCQTELRLCPFIHRGIRGEMERHLDYWVRAAFLGHFVSFEKRAFATPPNVEWKGAFYLLPGLHDTDLHSKYNLQRLTLRSAFSRESRHTSCSFYGSHVKMLCNMLWFLRAWAKFCMLACIAVNPLKNPLGCLCTCTKKVWDLHSFSTEISHHGLELLVMESLAEHLLSSIPSLCFTKLLWPSTVSHF